MNAYGKNTTQSENVLQKAALMNSEKHPSPTTSYRKGHVSPHPVKQYVKTNHQGYVIDLPGEYPIATPTFYKGENGYATRTDALKNPDH